MLEKYANNLKLCENPADKTWAEIEAKLSQNGGGYFR